MCQEYQDQEMVLLLEAEVRGLSGDRVWDDCHFSLSVKEAHREGGPMLGSSLTLSLSVSLKIPCVPAAVRLLI